MATNSGRGNPIDASDAPRGGDTAPPPLSDEVKGAIITKDASTSTSTSISSAAAAAAGGKKTGSDITGVHASGQEPGMRPDPRPKVEAAPPPKGGEGV